MIFSTLYIMPLLLLSLCFDVFIFLNTSYLAIVYDIFPIPFCKGNVLIPIHTTDFRLQEFAKLYDIIKNERNKCVNQIQTSTQVSVLGVPIGVKAYLFLLKSSIFGISCAILKL